MHIFNAGGSARWGPIPFMKKTGSNFLSHFPLSHIRKNRPSHEDYSRFFGMFSARTALHRPINEASFP